MDTHELNAISETICKQILSNPRLSQLLSLTTSEGQDIIAESIATKVINKMNEAGAFDVGNLDIEQLQTVVNQLQTNQEPDIVVKRME
jgi:hypothetical protein